MEDGFVIVSVFEKGPVNFYQRIEFDSFPLAVADAAADHCVPDHLDVHESVIVGLIYEELSFDIVVEEEFCPCELEGITPDHDLSGTDNVFISNRCIDEAFSVFLGISADIGSSLVGKDIYGQLPGTVDSVFFIDLRITVPVQRV